ncbi:diguanylate cyclase [Sulfurimonas sp.]|nr:diguanylate cyclase [Sulfurimonas sp.]
MSVKNKTLFIIATSLIVLSASIFYIVKMQKNESIELSKKEYLKNSALSYESILNKYKNFYRGVVLKQFNSLELKKSILQHDKNLVHKLISNKYEILKSDNKNLVMMNIHLKDNTFFLDMEDLSLERPSFTSPVIKKVEVTHKYASAYEQAKDKILLKSFHPIFYDRQYIGLIEMGVDIGYILEDMSKYSRLNGVKVDLLGNGSSFKLASKTLDDIEISEKLSTGTFNGDRIFTRRGKEYFVQSFDIKDILNLTISKFYFVASVDDSVYKRDLQFLLIFLIVIVIVTLLIINFTLSKSLKYLQDSFDNLYEYTDMIDNNIMMVDVSHDFIIIGVSQRFCDISGYTKDELLGKDFETLRDPETSKKLYEGIHKELDEHSEWSGEIQNRTKTGESYWLSTKIEAKFKDNKLFCYNYIMHNITARKMNEELVFIDDLTSLYNRKHFNDVFPRMVNGIKRNGGCINFSILDLDDFKKYNEIYGHSRGDEALIAVADSLIASLRRPDDYCFRLGGGEFGILFRSESEDEGRLYTQVLKKNIEMLSIKHKGNLTYHVLTASFGLVSIKSDNIKDEQNIYTKAYEHLQRAKADGRNKIVSKLL